MISLISEYIDKLFELSGGESVYSGTHLCISPNDSYVYKIISVSQKLGLVTYEAYKRETYEKIHPHTATSSITNFQCFKICKIESDI